MPSYGIAMNCERCQTDMTVNSSTGGHYCPVCADAENTLADSAIPTTLAPQNPATPALEHSSTVIVPEEDIKRSSVLKNGSMLGSYKIVGRIGRGGMGCVYKAEQQSPRRLVALKVLLHGQSSKEADRLRFKREAAVVALLDHPNIVPIIESGETECGELYYTMPLVEGVPLDTYVSEHKLPLRDILRLFSRVCAGVHAAHQRGAIHRDLKPGNILVNQAGRPQVLDFGLAKLVTEPEGSEATVMEGSAISEASIEVSRADEFLGTPAC
jgi:serine/threonine protein kinase